MTGDDRTEPRAHCLAGPDGHIAFTLTPPVPDPRPQLLLRRRTGTGSPDTDRRLLTLETGAEGETRAVLDPLPPLAEGRWDLYLLRAPDAEPERLRPGPRDLRALVDGHLRDRTAPVAARIPYPTKDGYLALRTWLRTAHAEAGRIEVGDRSTTVHARLHGTRLADGAVVRLCPRGSGGDREQTAPVHAGADGRDFRFTVDHRALAAGTTAGGGFWDVFVHPAPDAPPVRVARLLDDVEHRKGSFVYPAARTDGTDVRAYYTVDNDLSFQVGAAG
ncbi:transferase [Streptomyces sp. L2]|uniref:transferase n=1 Tax=Streptomyces sp. L2 TaxID=2162665 RepID=UPI001013B1FB|nr:transferase [Streptomyces sp. L2]